MKPYYQEAGITIYHGDCREVLPQLGPVDVVITDPPYGVGFKYASHIDDEAGFCDFILPVFEQLRQCAPLLMLTTAMRHLWLFPPATWVLCWAKPGSTRTSGLGGFSEWEPVLVYGKRRIFNDFKYLPDCVNHDPGNTHPCPKPLKLLTWLATVGSDGGQLILDPFMGSGTTLVAAKNLGRRAIGIEIEERYCEIAVKRLAQSVMQFGEVH